MNGYHCKYITEKMKGEWEALVAANSAGGFHQGFDWAEFKRDDGWESYKIGICDSKEQLVAGAVILKFLFDNGTNFIYIPEGPILSYDEDPHSQWQILKTEISKVVEFAPDSKTTHLRIEPRLTKVQADLFPDFQKAPLNLQPRHTHTIDLTQSEEEILAAMKQKCRYNIKIAKKNEVKVVTGHSLQEFHKLYKQTTTRAGIKPKTLEFFQSLTGNCQQIHKLFTASKDDNPLASALTIDFADRRTYLYGASGNSERKVMAPYLLHWEIIRDAKAAGLKEYDFWGIAPPSADSDHEWSGLTNFKLKFNGQTKSFIGALDLVYQPELYEAFVKKHES